MLFRSSDELLQEGQVRDLIRAVQNLRKDRGLAVTDRIVLSIAEGAASGAITHAVQNFEEYLRGETLTEEIEWRAPTDGHTVSVGENELTIAIRRA